MGMEDKERIIQVTPTVCREGAITIALTNYGRIFISEEIYKPDPKWRIVENPEGLIPF